MRYNEIAWRSGEVIYWTFTAIAGVIVLSVAANFVFDADRGEPVFRLIPLVLAGAVWLVGWVCRHVFVKR